jgi:hypothetical protein
VQEGHVVGEDVVHHFDLLVPVDIIERVMWVVHDLLARLPVEQCERNLRLELFTV